jgi:hypothetical protein
VTVPVPARQHFEAAGEAWSRYLKQAKGEPSATAAQLMAQTYFRLAETSSGISEAEEYVSKGAETQKIAAEQQPSLGSLSTLAIYQYFNGEFAAAEKTTKLAAAKASSKAEGKTVENQLAEYRKRGKEFAKQKKEVQKAERESGKEKLTNPFGGFGGAAAPGG